MCCYLAGPGELLYYKYSFILFSCKFIARYGSALKMGGTLLLEVPGALRLKVIRRRSGHISPCLVNFKEDCPKYLVHNIMGPL